MRSIRRLSPARLLTAVLIMTPLALVSLGAQPGVAATGASTASAGNTREISSSGTVTFVNVPAGNDGVASPEIRAQGGEAATAANRSHSSGATSVGAVSQPHPVTTSTPGLVTSFDGLNHRQNRLADGGNQFSLEPPDQGLCVGSDGNGNTRVLEVLNDVLRVYDTSGNPQTAPTSLNRFMGYPSAIVRSTRTFGPFVTDPSCLYDAATGHWFLDDLTIDVVPTGADAGQFTGSNHLDLAVSTTSDPTGTWTIYRIPVQDDGTAGTPDHQCSAGATTPAYVTNPHACFGDYPHLGSDANGIYLTTNEYSFFGPEFHGAQIYALSKAQLAAGAATVTIAQFDTHGLDTFGFGLNGFTLWPSQTPGGGGETAGGGTEYFLSSNAAAEAHDTGNGMSTSAASHQLLVWALSNTSSVDSAPALTLSVTKLDVGTYSVPPQAEQKSGNQPLRTCLNNNPCATFLNGERDPFTEKPSNIDSNDSRMQQVTFVNGQLWGALDTSLSVSSAKQAGIEWFQVAPSVSGSSVSGTLTNQGYVALGNANLTYPAIGITTSGKGVMGFTVVGSNYFPSAGYATIDSSGVGDVHIAAAGVGPDDGFSDYRYYGVVPGVARPRWGDYGAAVPVGSSVWIASEYIGQSCTLAQYQSAPFGSCGGTRTALANWDTRISRVSVG